MVGSAVAAIADSACVVEQQVEPAPVFMPPDPTNVDSRFTPDFTSLNGGNITFQTLQGEYNGGCKNPSGSATTAPEP